MYSRMGDCPELFNRLFGGSANLTNDKVLENWDKKLYHIVQYEFRNHAVTRKIMGMILENADASYIDLYKDIVCDHYRFMNPDLELDAAELQAIEGRIAEFYDILMAAKSKLLQAANSGPLNLERYVRRGAAGTTLRNNNEGILVQNNKGVSLPNSNKRNASENNSSSHSNNNNADRVNMMFDDYASLPRDGNVGTILATKAKYEIFIEQLKNLELKNLKSKKSYVAHAMMIYADITAKLIGKPELEGTKDKVTPDQVKDLFKAAADAAAASGDHMLHISALNLYGGFTSKDRSEPYKKIAMNAYKEAFNEANKYLPADDEVRKIVSLNYIQLLTQYAAMFNGALMGIANITMAQILSSISPEDPFRQRFLRLQVEINISLLKQMLAAEPTVPDPKKDAHRQAIEDKLRELIDMAIDAFKKVDNPDTKSFLKSQITALTEMTYRRLEASTKKGKYEEAIAIFERVKSILTDYEEIAAIDGFLEKLRVVSEAKRQKMKASLAAMTGRKPGGR